LQLTNKFFGLLTGFICCFLLVEGQVKPQVPSYPPLYNAGVKGIAEYAADLNNIYSQSDFHAFKTSAYRFHSISSLVDHLCPAHFSDVQKARSIYFWIAQNIRYHVNGNDQAQDAEYVFKHGQGVCEGFSNLFQQMSREAGLQAHVVIGYVKDERYERNKKLPFPNHAWNAVLVDGQWQLLDVTWASFNKVLDNEKALSERYFRNKLESNFFVDPDVFIQTHLPEDPMWQLTSAKLPFSVFLQQVEDIDAFISSRKENIPYKQMIRHHHTLDSIDQEIALCERMASNKWNNLKAYRLGMAYFYKAQNLYRRMNQFNGQQKIAHQEKAVQCYLKSLDALSMLRKEDFGFDYTTDLKTNIKSRIELLSFSN